LSEVWGAIWSKSSTLASPAAVRASTAALMWPLMVATSVAPSSGAHMHRIHASGYFARIFSSSER
jgi:hypothetical protein